MKFRAPAFTAAIAIAVAASSFATTSAHAQPPVETPSGATNDEASELFKKGNQAYKLKRWDEAETAFEAAWALKRSYDIAGNLGDVEMYLAKYQEAAEHLGYSLRKWPAGQEASRVRTAARFEEAKKQVGTLTLKVTKGATITINGKDVGKSPLAGPVFVTPGAATVIVTLGAKSEKKTVALDIGEAREIEIAIAGEAAAVGPVGPDAAAPGSGSSSAGDTVELDSSGMKPRTLALIAGAGLTLAAAGVGVFYTFEKSGAQDDADSLRSELSEKFGSQACVGSSAPSQCSDLVDALERRDDATQISTAAFIASGVLLAATTVTFLAWPSKKANAPKAGRISVFGAPQSHGAMMGLAGSF
jgi:hypothetical protein